ncbi:unnamed protein product, partial [Closterium sp. NIES-53]
AIFLTHFILDSHIEVLELPEQVVLLVLEVLLELLALEVLELLLVLEALELEVLEVLEVLELLFLEVLVLEVLELLEKVVLLVLEALELEVLEVLDVLELLVLEVLILEVLDLPEQVVLLVLEVLEVLLELLALEVLEVLLVLEVLVLLVLLVLVMEVQEVLELLVLEVLVLLMQEESELLVHPCADYFSTRSHSRPCRHLSRSFARFLRVVLLEAPASSLPPVPDPESDLARAASPTITRLPATVVTNPGLESTAAFALVTELVDFAAMSRLDYVASLVTESDSVCPPSIEVSCDRLSHFASMLLCPGGDPDALDIPSLCSYAEVFAGEYSSQWQTAMEKEMASWKSTGTYVDEVPPLGANIVDGMWIFRVKRPPGSPPTFKALRCSRLQSATGGQFLPYLLPHPEDEYSSGAAICCSTA